MRDEDGDTMENWNDEKLQQVVNTKHGTEKRMPTTDIVSVLLDLVFPLGLNTKFSFKDLQILPGSGRKSEVWLVLGVSERRKMYLSACLTVWICSQTRQKETGG